MARITIKDVKQTLGINNSYDIVNAIRNENPSFQNYVPLADATNVAEVGAGILINQTIQNEFITSLVDRIGLVVIRQISLTNPLKKFKKGQIPQGRTIEEIFTDITEGKKYNARESEALVFQRQIPNVKTLFHEMNRQDFYHQTIQDESLKTAFISWDSFDSFLSSIINAIYNSAEVEEYEYMKLLIDNYYAKGLFTVVPLLYNPYDGIGTTDFVRMMRATARKMTLPTGSRDFNALAVRTRSEMEDIHIFLDADLEAQMDVEVLARAFNMDRTTFLGNVTIIDGFSSSGLMAVMVDKDWFMVYDKLLKMETIRNPRGLYWNYYYHVWQVLSVSRFANAVAFVYDANTPKVTNVIVDPTIIALAPKDTFEFTAYVRQIDTVERVVEWAVVAGAGSTLGAGTTISPDGVLTIGETQTGELKVTATVSYNNGTTDVDVIGESIVTITM